MLSVLSPCQLTEWTLQLLNNRGMHIAYLHWRSAPTSTYVSLFAFLNCHALSFIALMTCTWRSSAALHSSRFGFVRCSHWWLPLPTPSRTHQRQRLIPASRCATLCRGNGYRSHSRLDVRFCLLVCTVPFVTDRSWRSYWLSPYGTVEYLNLTSLAWGILTAFTSDVELLDIATSMAHRFSPTVFIHARRRTHHPDIRKH